MDGQKYDKAPITEAVIEVRALKPLASAKDLEEAAKRLKATYPFSDKVQHVAVNLDEPAQAINIDHSITGFRLTSLDQADVCVLTTGGVVTSRLAPYLGWDDLFAKAQANYRSWRKCDGAGGPSRLGVRFINRIDVPTSGSISLEDYVRFHIRTPFPENPVSAFNVQAHLSAPVDGWEVHVASSSVQPAALVGHVSFLVDIDVACRQDLPTAEKKIWERLNEARAVKNAMFEQLITDKARELFK